MSRQGMFKQYRDEAFRFCSLTGCQSNLIIMCIKKSPIIKSIRAHISETEHRFTSHFFTTVPEAEMLGSTQPFKDSASSRLVALQISKALESGSGGSDLRCLCTITHCFRSRCSVIISPICKGNWERSSSCALGEKKEKICGKPAVSSAMDAYLRKLLNQHLSFFYY